MASIFHTKSQFQVTKESTKFIKSIYKFFNLYHNMKISVKISTQRSTTSTKANSISKMYCIKTLIK